jgi:hypothetical protein
MQLLLLLLLLLHVSESEAPSMRGGYLVRKGVGEFLFIFGECADCPNQGGRNTVARSQVSTPAEHRPCREWHQVCCIPCLLVHVPVRWLCVATDLKE